MGRLLFMLLSFASTAWMIGYSQAMINTGQGDVAAPAWVLWFAGFSIVAVVTSTILYVQGRFNA